MPDQHPEPPARLSADTDGHAVFAYLPRTLLLPDEWDGPHRVVQLDQEQARALAERLSDAAEDLSSAQLYAATGDTDPREPEPGEPPLLEAPPPGHRVTVVSRDGAGRVVHREVAW